MTRVAVVGHIEWVQFVPVERVPEPGAVIHAGEPFELPAGGGGVASVQLARLAGGADLFTALGEDERGRRAVAELEGYGVRPHVAWRSQPTRRAITLLDANGERTIITLGPRLEPRADDALPWSQLESTDGVYFTAGDEGALRAARTARVLVASPRARSALHPDVPLDALIYSARDRDEREWARQARAHLMIATEGTHGGSFTLDGGPPERFDPAPLPGPLRDSYGAGDSFAAGVTFGLARGDDARAAIALGARCAAACLSGRGPYDGRLSRG